MKVASAVLGLAAGALLWLGGDPVVAAPKARASKTEKAEKAPGPKGPTSEGAPNSGKLHHPKKWTNSRHARRPASKSDEASYALPHTIGLLHRASQKVASRFPNSVMLVGDLSGKHGGPLSGHSSHQNGRDVDVGFYVTNEQHKPTLSERFLPFDGQGKHSSSAAKLTFDEHRNWLLIEALLTDPKVEVRTIFVASWLKARLLKHAQETKAPRALVERAAAVLMQPPNSEPHHDHFHVRISCPANQKPGCVDDSFVRSGGGEASDPLGG